MSNCELIHAELQSSAVRSVNRRLVARNWLLGMQIVKFEQEGFHRAQYGDQLIETLAKKLNIRGLSGTGLRLSRQFYLEFPIHQSLPDELVGEAAITSLTELQADHAVNAVTSKFNLSWTHYVALLAISDRTERSFYETESKQSSWSVRELERQVNSSLYERLALSSNKAQIKQITEAGQIVSKPTDLIKNPLVLEFLGLPEHASFSENDLESAIINKLEHFMLELGKGFLFEARQKRFSFENDHFYVDLVFYNRLLRCYVLIDLKIGKLAHQDLGQMQMYVNYFDRHVKLTDENPTIGIVLCKLKNDSLVELTLPKDANIFATKYPNSRCKNPLWLDRCLTS